MEPLITPFDDDDGETEHVYVGRNLRFEVDEGRAILARIYDDTPRVATLVNISHEQAGEPSVVEVVRWLRHDGTETVKVMGPAGDYVPLSGGAE